LSQKSKIVPRKGIGALEPREVQQVLLVDGPDISSVPLCTACKGVGKTTGLLHQLDCIECFGSGVDLRHSVGIIKLLRGRIVKAEAAYRQQRQQIKHLSMTEAQRKADLDKRMGESVSEFYKDSKINKHD
jgi:hypothetical protein